MSSHLVLTHQELRFLIPRMDETALATLAEIADLQADAEIVDACESELESRVSR